MYNIYVKLCQNAIGLDSFRDGLQPRDLPVFF